MKRTLLTVISICLILASLFGVYSSSTGLTDISGILRNKHIQNQDIGDAIDLIAKQVKDLEEQADKHSEDEQQYAEGLVTDVEGSEKISSGQAQINSGEATLARGQAEYNSGKAQYDSAQKLYNQKNAEYQAAVKQLENAKAQLAAGKAERDQGQAKLDSARPAYNTVKPLYDQYQSLISRLGAGNALVTAAEQALSAGLSQFGYSSMGSLISEYESGEAQLNQANQEIAAAEQQIADGEAQLAAAKKQLDAGKVELANAKKQLDAGKAELDVGKAQLNNAKGQLANGKKTMDENSEKMADALDSLKEYDDAQQLVDTGINILLENEGIADKVTDAADYNAVLDAARDYLKEDTENINKELDIRQQLYSLLRILSFIGIIAGIVCLIAAYNPSLTKLRLALISAAVTAVGTAALNIMGFMNGYQYFVYALPDGSGSGSLQNAALVVLFIVSAIAAIIALSCLKSYAAGYAVAKVNAAEAFIDESNAPESIAEAEAVESDPAPAKSSTTIRKGQPSYKPSKKNRVFDDEYSAAYVGEAPEDKAEAKDTEPLAAKEPSAEPVNAEAPKSEEPEAAKNIQSDYEAARREFEEARRKYEEARKRREQK